MKIAVTAKELTVDGACAFVPTMGALTCRSCFSYLRKRANIATQLLSVFLLTHLQFENKDDLAKYPRTPEFDIETGSKQVQLICGFQR